MRTGSTWKPSGSLRLDRGDDNNRLVADAAARMESRVLGRVRQAVLRWKTVIEGLDDEQLAGLDVAVEIELERRHMLDRPPGGRARL